MRRGVFSSCTHTFCSARCLTVCTRWLAGRRERARTRAADISVTTVNIRERVRRWRVKQTARPTMADIFEGCTPLLRRSVKSIIGLPNLVTPVTLLSVLSSHDVIVRWLFNIHTTHTLPCSAQRCAFSNRIKTHTVALTSGMGVLGYGTIRRQFVTFSAIEPVRRVSGG